MASTYTTNLGIEKIGTGEQSGTWGDTTNTNFDILDEAINGIISVTLSSAGSSGSPTALPITDGASSNGRNKFIEFADGGDLGATAYVQLTPNNAEKIVHIRNSLSGSRSIIVFQGTYNASNDFEIPNGADVTLKFNGGGTGATVTDVNVDLTVTGATIATADINGGTIDGAVIGGASAAAGTFTTANATTVDTTSLEVTNIKAKDGTSAGSIADSTGVVTLASSVLTTADINGGTADGVTIGGSTAAAGTFTTFTSTGITDGATSTAVTIDSSGNVGIGTTSPSTTLDVKGSARIERDGSSALLQFTDTGVNSRWMGLVDGTSRFAIYGTNGSTEELVINSSGNVGIGTTSPAVKTQIVGSGAIFRISDDVSTSGTIELSASSSEAVIHANTYASAVPLVFKNASTERMRIDSSGNVLVGASSSVVAGSEAVEIRGDYGYIKTGRNNTGATGHMLFYNPNGNVGSITTSGSTTAYNTSSDQRLKENIVDAPAGNIDAIRVRSFDWKVDGSHQTYGMVAQELVDVAPEAVSQGETEDDMWGVDYSKLVPMMIKEIQDLKAEVAALKGE